MSEQTNMKPTTITDADGRKLEIERLHRTGASWYSIRFDDITPSSRARLCRAIRNISASWAVEEQYGGYREAGFGYEPIEDLVFEYPYNPQPAMTGNPSAYFADMWGIPEAQS